ncbi:MAG: tyrosine--tRNA ligase [Bacteroidetes bacterium RIFOXYA12_FULL_35_11]|nr:MAG: tyrosine--tRNA ligase [Bacteroidetes bacterium GWF2_35_48]OFY73375.1 MAG: tyrosine--tRNA ligase [Bacteroidetes bacterium RIFOXYA12_FULL_35_11]OFZ00180.1 MAG: tyrosine--tRNA ligase [Bacteroidetes bacterium RIFOXYC12_FULL_35_7]HBX53605.1 tyrosine--tRNA ligase [Bacteroidales bacterium]
MTNFIEELKWRGMIHDVMPGTDKLLETEMTSGYIGFDPTSDSLHVGSLAQIMTLLHFQRAGHKPMPLVGGATGMVGDPSGKSQERNLLDEEELRHNVDCIGKQLAKFLDFNCGANSAELVNNYDWTKDVSFLQFIRDIGKHITINYMMAKDSVQNRLEGGMSFCEFTYQLLQGFDFYHLYTAKNCKLQMGGSDQWGNIVTGTELIRRKTGGEAFALTTQLIKKADGTKFGKTESGNIWLDRKKTSPYKFYQFWLNSSDEDSKKYIRIFTLYTQDEIIAIEKEHEQAPHLRILQKSLAKDITIRVHSEEDYNAAVEASEILFGKGTSESLSKMDEETFLSVFEGVPQFKVSKSELEKGIPIAELFVDKASIFPSKGELRRTLQGGGVYMNKELVSAPEMSIGASNLINGKYILAQKGKKNYFLIIAE